MTALISQLFQSAGCGSEEAACIADHLVAANLAGHDSHGVIRAPIYIKWLRKEMVFAGRSLEVVVDSDVITVADGQLGFGQWIGKQAVDIGIRKCQAQGVSVLALRNSGHLGRIGHWAEMAADAGLVSLNFVNTSGLGMMVVPHGGIDRRLSVNPVCMSIPIKGRKPIVLDIAAAQTAEGKLKVARNKGVPVPDGWIIDSNGQPTNDPNDFYNPPGGAILPLGGHKGYGLGLIADVLAGALTGGGCSAAGKTKLEQGMLSIYIDPLRLQTAEALFPEIQRFVDCVKTSRPAEPGGEILIPGEIEERNRAERQHGIELDDTTWQQIVEIAVECGVPNTFIAAAEQSVGS